MLVRYGISSQGILTKKAGIYTAAEHLIDTADIDPDAERIIHRLRSSGFKAYIVGGAVRDLLSGRKPKDFDIATEALPGQIRGLFSNSRIIGRRFRIVHVYYTRNAMRKIIEVSTFRSKQKAETNNVYGPIGDDAWRRDFTLNALYYCPVKQIIIDYVNGYKDIKQKRIRTLMPVESSFMEDPVRMVRGVKYAALTGFRIPNSITSIIKQYRHELSRCSPERVTEEVYKILKSGSSASMFLQFFRLKLLEVFLPAIDQMLHSQKKVGRMFEGLKHLDKRIQDNPYKRISRGELLSYLFLDWFNKSKKDIAQGDPVLIQKVLRDAALPLLPSKRELEIAASNLIKTDSL